jgi:hypothetical protein
MEVEVVTLLDRLREVALDQHGYVTTAPALAAVGLPVPDHLVGLAMRYQIAQKVHAVTDPHDPPTYENDRARDVADLVLLKRLTQVSRSPTLAEIRAAITDIFEARAAEASTLGFAPRLWPARLIAYPHWQTSYAKAAESAGLELGLVEAITEGNSWLDQIDAAE